MSAPLASLRCVVEALELRQLLSAGALDTSFGHSGHVFADFNSVNEQPLGLQLQTDKKVVVSGTWGLARYTQAGKLDPTFGDGGVVAAAGLSRFVIQPDGKILCATTTGLARYNSNGTLDHTFAGDGTQSVAGGVYDLSLLTDGRIVTLGPSTALNAGSAVTVRRFTPSGSADKSFAGGSVTITPPGDRIDRLRLTVQTNGKVVLGGVAWTNDEKDNNFTLLRLNADGTLDTSYGTSGAVLYHFDTNIDSTQWDRFGDLAIAPDNRVVISAVSPDFSYVYRFSTKGVADLTYANDGNQDADALAVQPDGRILVAGGTHVPGVLWAVRRLTRGGKLDANFGDDGTAAYAIGDGDRPYYIAVGQGELVTAGVHFRQIPAPGGGTMVTQDLTLVDMNSGPLGTSPWRGVPWSIPGTIQAENFDLNGALDQDAANLGGQYRYSPADIEQTTDAGGGYNLAWCRAGEWLQYTVRAKATARYRIAFRVASVAGGGRFYITINGKKVSTAVFIPPTGGQQRWATVTLDNVLIAKGTHALRIVFDRNGPDGFAGKLNWMRFSPQ